MRVSHMEKVQPSLVPLSSPSQRRNFPDYEFSSYIEPLGYSNVITVPNRLHLPYQAVESGIGQLVLSNMN